MPLLFALNQRLQAGNLPLRLVDPELAHLTLHFLGETTPERAELLKLALPAVVVRHQPLHLETGGLGVFPGERKPRVVWLGLNGDTARLANLHKELGRSLASMGFEVENRSLQAHITLARARDGAPQTFASDLQRVIGEASIRNDLDVHRCDFTVRHVELIRSHLEKTGPRYETLARLPLNGAAR